MLENNCGTQLQKKQKTKQLHWHGIESRLFIR